MVLKFLFKVNLRWQTSWLDRKLIAKTALFLFAMDMAPAQKKQIMQWASGLVMGTCSPLLTLLALEIQKEETINS